MLRRDALWRDADQVLSTRAMMRCALAAGWIVLAALTIPGYAWACGIAMLLSSGLALLHASRTLVVRIEETANETRTHAGSFVMPGPAVLMVRSWGPAGLSDKPGCLMAGWVPA